MSAPKPYWLGLLLLTPCLLAINANAAQEVQFQAPRAAIAPVIDGVADDAAWAAGRWYPVDQRWLGPQIGSDDFTGRFKLAWNEERLYILFEFSDDTLIDTHRDPLVQYWDDDTLEIFIDEDHSGGDHQYNHNAFAYHFSLDNQAIDIGTDKAARDYSHHTESRWRQHPDRIVWEVSIAIYSDEYRDDASDNQPVPLEAGKIMGFMLAYCDNDGSDIRENFMGSTAISGPGKDRGWIDAGVFSTLKLIE